MNLKLAIIAKYNPNLHGHSLTINENHNIVIELLTNDQFFDNDFLQSDYMIDAFANNCKIELINVYNLGEYTLGRIKNRIKIIQRKFRESSEADHQ